METLKGISVSALFDLGHTVAAELFSDVSEPWSVLAGIKDYIRKLGPTLDSEHFDQIAPDVWVAKSATVAPTAFIGGPAVIDERAEVRHCAFIRGGVIIGKDCVVGNSTELKNVVLFDNVQVPHYNYVGDSVLGYRAHMGAGAATSNVKSDKSLVTVSTVSGRIITGLKKFGAMVGDSSEIGCNAVLCPGTVIGRGSTVYPLTMVRGFIPERTIVKQSGETVQKR